MLHMILPRIMGKKLMPLFEYKDGWPGYNNPLLKGMLSGFVEEVVCPMISKSLDTLWELQKEKKRNYGDADNSFWKYRLTEKVRVSVIKDFVTMSDIDRFLFVEP